MSAAMQTGIGTVSLIVPTALVAGWIHSAGERLKEAEAAPRPADQQAAVASAADEGYCNAELKKVLRRVLMSCGLASAEGGGAARGCQPLEAKSIATLSGDDFNALFLPLKDRAGIIQFDQSSAELDQGDLGLVSSIFADRRGASYFLVVSRSSPEGSVETNRALSEHRGAAVMDYLRGTFKDQELEKEVGILWLGEEYAQLNQDFCQWNRSGGGEACAAEDLNRSAFIAWIDCRL
jgi:outer membrane protein OmpA-like peptidoglycan-associated protein